MNISILTLTVKAAVELQPNRGVTVAGGIPASGSDVIGFSRSAGGPGDLMPVDVLGTTMAEAGAAVPAGAYVEVDDEGRIVPHASGVKVGRLAPGQFAATRAGQVVEILLLPN